MQCSAVQCGQNKTSAREAWPCLDSLVWSLRVWSLGSRIESSNNVSGAECAEGMQAVAGECRRAPLAELPGPGSQANGACAVGGAQACRVGWLGTQWWPWWGTILRYRRATRFTLPGLMVVPGLIIPLPLPGCSEGNSGWFGHLS